jgi:hypothetical protein
MFKRQIIFALPLILPLLAADEVAAHRSTAGGSQSGIAIPEISHGEMVVMAQHRAGIIALAARATDTNEPFRRVLNYARIQYAYCLWGKMPGAVTDEASPFNECSHAYLAATKLVLMQMREMPREADAAGAIVSEIDARMVESGLALITCAYSGETFNTADVLRPHWADVPTHPASMASLTLLAGILALGTLAFSRLLGRTTV